MRLIILCTLFLLTRSQPDDYDIAPQRSRLVGNEESSPLITKFPEADETGFVRFRFCWADPGWEAEKRVSEEAAKAWERAAKLSIDFLENCDDIDPDVTPIYTPIYIRDARPFLLPDQDSSTYKSAQVLLNFEFKRTKELRACNSPDRRQDCIRFLAMHQMGHAIGLHHHPHYPTTCTIDKNFGVHHFKRTYDENSIMNYCNDKVWIDPKLSPADVEEAQRAYGAQ